MQEEEEEEEEEEMADAVLWLLYALSIDCLTDGMAVLSLMRLVDSVRVSGERRAGRDPSVL